MPATTATTLLKKAELQRAELEKASKLFVKKTDDHFAKLDDGLVSLDKNLKAAETKLKAHDAKNIEAFDTALTELLTAGR